MNERNVVNRTHFQRSRGQGDDGAWQWYWKTRANNGQITAVGGDGYDELRGAINGFFSTHGIDPNKASLRSDFGKIQKFDDNHYVIVQYESESLTTE